MSELGDKIYIFNPQSNQFIPYRADYTAGIPIQDFDVIQKQRLAKQKTPARDNQLGIIVPLIAIPPRQSDWAQLTALAQKYPRVNTVGVVSPSQDVRGIDPNFGPDAEFANAIHFLQNSGVIVLGYVDFSVGKTADQLRLEINVWREYYPNINGLYFDNIRPDANLETSQYIASFAKVDKGFRYIFANLAGSTSGGVVNRPEDFVDALKGVDTFIIYEREGYPADGWYASMKKDWMSQYPRSKFAFVAYRVGPETLACRNFIDKCVSIERMAGYVYAQSTNDIDRRPMREWTNISPLTEICLQQLDTAATTENIPQTRGVTPQTGVVDAQKRDALLPPATGTPSNDQPGSITATVDMNFDKFGVRKVYPSVTGDAFNEWYLFEENIRADANFKNVPDKITREADGSWVTVGDKKKPVRLEAWSPRGSPFLNVEMTGYFKAFEFDSGTLIELLARTGHKEAGTGAAYIGKLMTNGTVAVQKAINKNALTGNRGTTQATTEDLENRWIGLKFVVYNYTEIIPKSDGQTKKFVGMEIWIDDNVTDLNGRLVVKNDWRHVMSMNDEGGWIAAVDSKAKKDKKKGKKNKPLDTILTTPNEGDGRNCVAWKWENYKVAFKHLSVREIARILED